MTKWLARVLSWLPGFVLAKASARGRSIRNGWLRRNETVQAHARSYFQTGLLGGSSHPILFVAFVVLVSVGVAKLVVSQAAARWGVHAPTLKADFDFPTFVGVPWSVQATVVGLVYPIVISFIALMLQRRTHSTAALRMYALDSGVIPAGASSVGLLAALTLQFFGALHAAEHKEDVILPLLAFDATWFAINLGLTAYFLARTIRFLQDDEQSLTLRKLTVDAVLRQELSSIATQRVAATAPVSRWGQPPKRKSWTQPQVDFLLWVTEADSQVRQRMDAGQVVTDVQLNLLGWVARRWLRRAAKHVSEEGALGPRLQFRDLSARSPAGVNALCAVSGGPGLTRVERLVVKLAYVVRRGRDVALGLSTAQVLAELALECQSQAEDGQFSKAETVFLELLDLHKILLASCAFVANGEPDNAALLHAESDDGWSRNLHGRWLSKYDELARLGVRLLDRDDRLFRLMAYLPAALTSALPPRPSSLLSRNQDAVTMLARELGLWWIREAQLANLMPGPGQGGKLPPPLDKVYDSALSNFIGAWNSVHVVVPPADDARPDVRWNDLVARCLVYATHIDHSAELFLDAMARGDEAAAARYCDHFLKWWGLHSSGLEISDLEYEPEFEHIDFSIAGRTWEDVVNLLSGFRVPFGVRLAERALNLGLRRYWESVRVLLALLCLKNAGATPTNESREVRMTASLIGRTPLHTGSDVEADSLDDPGALLNRLVLIFFGEQSTIERLDGICNRLRWDSQTPEVPGWPYSWSGTPLSMRSLMPEQCGLLCSVADVGGVLLTRAKASVERLWRDIDGLAQAREYFDQMRDNLVSDNFKSGLPAVGALRRNLGRPPGADLEAMNVVVALGRLADTAAHERRLTIRALTVSEAAVRRAALQLAEAAFGAISNRPFGTVSFRPNLVTTELSLQLLVEKRRLVDSRVDPLRDDEVKHEAKRMRRHANDYALFKYLEARGRRPLESAGVGSSPGTPSEPNARFLSEVAAACDALSGEGRAPAVLVMPGVLSGALQPYRWLPARGYATPPGVVLREGDPQAGDIAKRYINEAPIFESSTPEGRCFVVPWEEISVLVVRGSDASSAVSFAWEQYSDEQVLITLRWQSAVSLSRD